MPRGRRNQNEAEESAQNQDRQESLAFQVSIDQYRPEKGVLATASVKIGNELTVRNVKIKEDDYGYNVVMPKTQIKDDGGYKDCIYFESKLLKEQFDQAVITGYSAFLQRTAEAQDLEDQFEDQEDDLEEDSGMNMGM